MWSTNTYGRQVSLPASRAIMLSYLCVTRLHVWAYNSLAILRPSAQEMAQVGVPRSFL
jgi:hypothetical protein